MTTELEFKWVLGAPIPFDALVEMAADLGWRVTDQGVRDQVDSYVDGPDGQIAAQGAGLRVRRQLRGEAPSAVVCFKGPAQAEGDAVRRVELEEPWASDELPTTTADVPERLRGVLGDHPLQRRVELRTERHWAWIEREENRGELVLDQVEGRGETDRVVEFTEVELEVRAGSATAFADLADRIRTRLDGVADAESKLKRVTRLLGD